MKKPFTLLCLAFVLVSNAQTITNFGVLPVFRDTTAQINVVENLGADYVRDMLILTQWNGIKSYHVDTYLNQGYKVLLNISYAQTPAPFLKDTVVYESKLRSALAVYSPEVVVVENEELNVYQPNSSIYFTGPLQDYINELRVGSKGMPRKRFAGDKWRVNNSYSYKPAKLLYNQQQIR